jgi:hypothetical protein
MEACRQIEVGWGDGALSHVACRTPLGRGDLDSGSRSRAISA